MNISAEYQKYTYESVFFQSYSKSVQSQNNNSQNSEAVSFSYEKFQLSFGSFCQEGCEKSSRQSLYELLKDPERADELKKMFQPAGAQEDKDLEARIDELDAMLGKWSSDETAKRIYDFATGFYGYYTNKFENGEQSQDGLDRFMNLVHGAIDTGFSAATEESGAVSDEVAGVRQRTYDKIQDKLNTFYEEQKNALSGNSAEVYSEEEYYSAVDSRTNISLTV